MVGTGAAVSTFSRAKTILSVSVLTFVVVVILSHAILMSIQAHSIEPGLRDVGKRFAGVTQDVNDETLAIMAQGGIYDGSKGPLRGFWNAFLLVAVLISSLGIFWLWITVLAWIIERTISDSTAQLRNYILAISIFFVIQIVYLLATSPEPNKFALIAQPFMAFWHLWQALPCLIAPADTAINAVDMSPALNNTIGKILWIS